MILTNVKRQIFYPLPPCGLYVNYSFVDNLHNKRPYVIHSSDPYKTKHNTTKWQYCTLF